MKIKMETVVSATAMITAIIAVIIGIVQTQVMSDEAEIARKHQEMSVLPVLWVQQSTLQNKQGFNFTYSVRNNGLGPAIIESFQFKYKGQAVSSWQQAISVISTDLRGVDMLGGKSFASYRSPIPAGFILPAGEERKPLTITNSPEVAKLLYEANEFISIDFCYCSMYQSCWQTQGLNTRPIPVQSCPTTDLFDSGNWQQYKKP